MKFHWLALPGIFVAGCIASDGLRSAALSDNNIWNISRISEGMSETQVMQIMGKPYDYKTFCAGDDVYDVWFYVTNPSMLGQTRLVKQNLTPLSFKNGVLIGWGYHYYDKVLAAQKQTQQRAEPLPEERIPSPEEDEKSLEEVLKKAPEALPAPPKAPPLSQTNALPGRPPEADEPPAIEDHTHNGKPKEQPPAPPQPPKPKKQVSRKTMAMSQSSDSQMPEDAQPQEDEPFDEEGENMLDGESEQDFNFW